MSRPLPQPIRSRWQPLRAGLVDLFYYDAEEFWFHDGRLLLRGNNGTGKSKVLALMLPFLLDGELSPHRVEPDADPKKRMEWNLLLGGAHPFPERLGYTWLEFGRLTEDGTPQFRTLGCGLKAVSGKGIARHWFFLTSQRPGADLELVDATGTALTKDRLVEALGEHGTPYDTARAYRRAVDEALFGLGEQRYGALVDLLVQLRQPQLSKKPSEKALSDALTEALPPLDQAVVADVAEAFRSLEEDRDALRAMAEAHSSAKTFLGHYQRYAAVASRRRAAGPRKAQSAYDTASRELGEAEAAYVEADLALQAAKDSLAELKADRERLLAQDEALRLSPEMRSARELELAAENARRLSEEAQQAVTDRTTAESAVTKRRRKRAEAADALAATQAHLAELRRSALDSAATARIDGRHTEQIDARLDAELDAGAVVTLRTAADDLHTRQAAAVRHVERLLDEVDARRRALVDARKTVENLAGALNELAQQRQDASEAVAERGADLISSMRTHLAELVEVALPDPASTLAELELWTETLNGPNPGRAAVEAGGRIAAARHARTEAELDDRDRAAREAAGVLIAEIDRLESGEDTAPPVPYTRDAGSRRNRPGAPLWRLVDFADTVLPDDRSGIEAALEAAGILDGWVTPEGELLAADTEDVLLRPAPDSGGQASSLRRVLVPAVDRDDGQAGAVTDQTVLAVLGAIGFGEHGQTWVAPSGRYRVGVLTGAWHKPAAEFVGSGAREAARRAKLIELRAQLADVTAQQATIETERAHLAGRRRVLATEVTTVPGDDELRAAHAAVGALGKEYERVAGRHVEAEDLLETATAAAETASSALTETAADLGLPVDRAELDDVGAALSNYRVALASLWPAIHARLTARAHDGDAAGELAEAEAELHTRNERVNQAQSAARSATERHETLRETVGAAVAELQRRLAEVAQLLRHNEADQNRADEEKERAGEARGRAVGRKEKLAEKVTTAATERATAAESLRRFVHTGLLAVALPDLDVPDPQETWAPVPTVRLARQIEQELADVTDDDGAWDRAQRRLNDEFKNLTDTLARQGSTASAQLRDEGIVVEIVFRGRPTTVPDLEAALSTEVDDRQRLLDEREREILENHLINEVASTLHELITEAERQVSQMNSELADRPTSTGMRLRLLWQPRPDGPSGLAQARERLLRQTSDAWSDVDRAAVGGFLQARISEVRANDPTGTWLEHLTTALDYRAWNRFVIQRHQNGQWKPATGPASGGERVLAASVPLFAAASAHYLSASNPHAPRLVTLDEAFAGVDDNARAKYLGLLAAFDLDVVMTSEREWGCYPEVPGLAIAQLSRTDDVAAVLVTNWQWDGRNRIEMPRPMALATVTAAPSEASAESRVQEGLWSGA